MKPMQKSKIIVPTLILLVIVGIYFAKQDYKSRKTTQNTVYPLQIKTVNLEEIKTYGVPTMIDFGSQFCFECKTMEPVLITLNEEFEGEAAVQYLDVLEFPEGYADVPVQVIPTQIFFDKDGNPFSPSDSLASLISFETKESGGKTLTLHQGALTEDQLRQIFAEMGVE